MTIRKQQWPPYDLVRDLKSLERQVKQLAARSARSAWYDYTLEWTSSGTQPSFGGVNPVARYQRIGRTCIVRIDFTFDGTVSFGSGQYTWTVPFISAAWGAIGYFNALVGSTRIGGQLLLPNNTNTITAHTPTSGSPHTLSHITNTVPVTWASGNRIRMGIEYEVAEGQ